jgi:hypothetical protein
MRTAQQVDRNSLAKAGEWLIPGAEGVFRERIEVDGIGEITVPGEWTSAMGGRWTICLCDQNVTVEILPGSFAADVSAKIRNALSTKESDGLGRVAAKAALFRSWAQRDMQ